MVYLIYMLMGAGRKLIENSVFMGPDGGIYDIFVSMIYLFVQLYVFMTPKFLEKLPNRCTMGIVAMVLLFLPGIIILGICKRISKAFNAISWKIRILKRRRRKKHERKHIFSDH